MYLSVTDDLISGSNVISTPLLQDPSNTTMFVRKTKYTYLITTLFIFLGDIIIIKIIVSIVF